MPKRTVPVKVEEDPKPRPKKPPGYRAFAKLLKQVVNAPPLKRASGPETYSPVRVRE